MNAAFAAESKFFVTDAAIVVEEIVTLPCRWLARRIHTFLKPGLNTRGDQTNNFQFR
jgi:hypothetical protein